ncbi:hypothetical protein B6K05_017810 [Mycobacterium avium subsp. hominissuis]|nr:hypothetical protein B6K05_017810 [Mycobacterium avium subsp. hominissuis]
MADNGLGPILADPILAMAADVVDDLERIRCANENRLRTLTDDSENGHGLSVHNPDVARLAALVDGLKASEHQAILNLQRVMRNHPLGAWVKASAGVGEKQAARLLGVIRDPYWNDLHGRPRKLRELYAYCGFHVLGSDTTVHGTIGSPGVGGVGVAPARRRGQKANWNGDARKRVWLIAASCIKQANSPYRAIYDQAREKYADAVHPADCVRCGPSGKPAPAGTPLSAGHQHARAMRLMCKAILADIWAEAERIHKDMS